MDFSKNRLQGECVYYIYIINTYLHWIPQWPSSQVLYWGLEKLRHFFKHLQKPPSFFEKRTEIPCISETTNHGTLGFSWKFHVETTGTTGFRKCHTPEVVTQEADPWWWAWQKKSHLSQPCIVSNFNLTMCCKWEYKFEEPFIFIAYSQFS